MQNEFVGRDRELAVLHECLEAALEGHTRLVLCQGEGGIGKTRLTEELMTRAAARGLRGVWGPAGDSPGAPPYWPWRQVLRSLSDFTDLAALAEEHRLAADLAGLVPDLFTAPPSTVDRRASTEDRFRQFDAVAALLRQLARRDPLVIAFDDAHVADQPSMLLLRHVARSMNQERLLVVVNHRETGEGSGPLLTELLREPVTRVIALGGLDLPAVARQLASVVGHDVGDSDVAQVHAMTGGNPFFVAEVGMALAARQAGESPSLVTANLREAIRARVHGLSTGCVRLLHAASIVGRQASLDVVASVLDLPAATCLAMLDEAVASGLIEITPSPRELRFAHALIRDAVEAGMSTPERVLLHRRAAEAVEQLYGDGIGPHLFDLARHWSVAVVDGDRVRAVRWMERAGDEALRRNAYEEAGRLYGLALDVGALEIDSATRCRLLLSLGSALHLSLDVAGGLRACVEAAAVASQLGRADLMAEAALVTEPSFDPAVDLRIRQLCETAMTALGVEHPGLRSRLAARLAQACDNLGDEESALAASEQAITLAERSGDRAALVAALHARQLATAGPDRLDERASLAERILVVGRQAPTDAEAQLWGHLWRIDVAFERGELAAGARELDAVAPFAQEVRGRLARWQVLRCRAVLAQAQARFDEAGRLGAQAFDTLAPTGHPLAFVVRAGLLATMGHHIGYDPGVLAANGLGAGEGGTSEFPTAGVIRALAPAWMLAEVGRLREASAIYRSLGPVAEWRPIPHATLFVYAFGVALASALDASDDVAALHARLSPYRGHHVVSGSCSVSYFGPVELWLGTAAVYLDLLDDAVVDLEQAVKASAASGAAGFHAESKYELAAALACRARVGDASRARGLAGDAVTEANALGMSPIVDKACRLRDRLDASSPTPPTPLTPREREVAELVAQGLTSREIGARLYLSERTAQNHVQHILTKLNLPNRSQIAVWVTGKK